MRIRFHDHSRNEIAEWNLADALSKHFTIVPQTQIAAAALSETQLAGFQFAERVIAGLATQTTKISDAATRNFEEFVAGVKERSLELEDNFQKKAVEVENRFAQKERELTEQHTAKLKDLETREKAHSDAVKQFEMRNNTAVRRDLLREIRSKIEEQKTIQISDATIQKRRIVHLVCASTLLLSATLIGLFAFKLFKETTIEWKLLVPLSTATAVFVMTGIYYIKWNDQWFRDHARVEFENRKFSADILRASWIAELFFEWAEKKGINMPPELVGSFTKNLFDGTVSDSRLHPTDQMNDLMKQFSTLEVGKSGFKVTRKEEKS